RTKQAMPSSAAVPSFVTVVISFLRRPSVAESRDPQYFLCPGLAGPVHDDRDPDQTERTAQQIEAVGRDAVDGPAPDNREHDEHAAVRRVDAAEMLRLVRRDESIEDEDGGAQHPDERRRALAPPLPDEMAALVERHPDRFPAFVASLPMNNPEAALREIDRALDTLGATGVQMFSNVAGRPLDRPEYRPLFARMAARDLPIWLHPARPATVADYAGEARSQYDLWWAFGWPYETSVAMGRLVFSGLFDRH